MSRRLRHMTAKSSFTSIHINKIIITTKQVNNLRNINVNLSNRADVLAMKLQI